MCSEASFHASIEDYFLIPDKIRAKCRSRSGKPVDKVGENWLFLFVCSVTSSGLCIYSMFRNLWVNDFEKSKRSTRKWKFLIFQISLSLSVFFPLVMHHKPHWGAIFLPATFNLFMGFSRQEYWSGLLFPSPVDHILSELPTMPQPSWVALHTMTHSFIKLDKAVAHVISLISFLWLWLSFCLPFEG